MNRTTTLAAATANDRPLRPHDLLWVADASMISATEPLPDWATREWLMRVPAVIRRENADRRGIPIGLRGTTRSERFRAYLVPEAVRQRVSPEELAASRVWRDQTGFDGIAALAALAKLAPLLDAIGLAWGPTGSVGFALASGLPVLRRDSDLDLVLRAPGPPTIEQREMLAMLSAQVACRLDVQIDTGRGAFAFAEWIAGHQRVLLKTDSGPVLTDVPWSSDTPARAAAQLTR